MLNIYFDTSFLTYSLGIQTLNANADTSDNAMFYIMRGKAEAYGLVPSIAVKGLCGICGWSGSLNKFEDHNQAHIDHAFGTDYVCSVLPLNGFEVEKKTGNPVRIKHDKNEGLEIACADDSNASGKAVWDHTQKTPEEIEAAVKEATKHAEEEHDADNEQGEGVVPKGERKKRKRNKLRLRLGGNRGRRRRQRQRLEGTVTKETRMTPTPTRRGSKWAAVPSAPERRRRSMRARDLT